MSEQRKRNFENIRNQFEISEEKSKSLNIQVGDGADFLSLSLPKTNLKRTQSVNSEFQKTIHFNKPLVPPKPPPKLPPRPPKKHPSTIKEEKRYEEPQIEDQEKTRYNTYEDYHFTENQVPLMIDSNLMPENSLQSGHISNATYPSKQINRMKSSAASLSLDFTSVKQNEMGLSYLRKTR